MPFKTPDPPKHPLDRKSPVEGMTFRELVADLDAVVALGSDWEFDFVTDAVDHPERFTTQAQLDKIVELWRRRCE